MTAASHDKIRILLVDDMPDGLPQDLGWPHPRNGPPQMDVDYDEWFDFRWVATPEEACEYRDLSWLVGQHEPETLNHRGWLPELLVVDYALTQDTRTVADRVAHADSRESWVARLSPLPALRECAARNALIEDSREKRFSVTPRAGSEYWGCFIGGLLMTTFSDHACAPLTVTRYNQTTLGEQCPDAKFFEELMEVQSSGLLHATGLSASPTWRDIIPRGMRRLRQRIVALARANMIQISLDDLLSLADDGNHEILTVSSRYGRRRYPIQGLFIDNKDDPQQWARRQMEEAWASVYSSGKAGRDQHSGGAFEELAEASKLARSVWAAYVDKDTFAKRERLSELEALREETQSPRGDGPVSRKKQPTLTSDQTKTLEDLKHYFAVDGSQCGKFADVLDDRYSTKARRWAALFLVVRVLYARVHAVVVSHARRSRAHTSQIADVLANLPLNLKDVYLALFPLPRRPVALPWHKGDVSSAWRSDLLKISVDVTRILNGEGIEPKERRILRMYAESVGADGEERLKQEVRNENSDELRKLQPADAERSLAELVHQQRTRVLEHWRADPVARKVFWPISE